MFQIYNAVDNQIRQHGEIAETMKKETVAFSLYLLPVNHVFRRAQTDHKLIYAMGTAKKILKELDRLTIEVGDDWMYTQEVRYYFRT
jgi:hypothetical protein